MGLNVSRVSRSARTVPPSSKGGGNGGNGGGERGGGDARSHDRGGRHGHSGFVLDLRSAGHDHLLDVLQVRSVDFTVTGFSTLRQPGLCGLKTTNPVRHWKN